MTGLSQDERKSIAEKLMEFGNLWGIGLIVAQLVPTQNQFSSQLALAGVLAWIGWYIFAVVLLRGGGRQ